jgi:hypothetical protein
MYKYLSIATNVQEMMVMVRSLPVCTIVLDRYARIVEMNQAALNFFKINSKNDYKINKWIVLNDTKYLKHTIKELKTGKQVKDKIKLIRCPDFGFKNLNISASMLEGAKQVFIFQFIELSVSAQEDSNRTSEFDFDNIEKITLSKDYGVRELLTYQELELAMVHPYINDDKAKLLSKYISTKYPDLSISEICICILIALRMSTREIAVITKRKPSYISYIVYRLLKRFDLRFRIDLSYKLINECFELQKLKIE